MNLLPQEIIRRKRDGEALAPDEIEALIHGLTTGAVSEGQAAAFAMAVFFRGLAVDERVALTRAMTRSGTVLTWDLPGPIIDKHSTGGVGDAVSLSLAPAVAACGAFVPMIAGRGLGHTGGTLDKLDAIPGYVSQPDLDTFRRVVRKVGCAIIGQTADLAPADRRLYAIRDVTATVESIDLITASILSKKLAAGLQGLVMDVKFGSGAFMSAVADARALAESLVLVAGGAGLPTTALLTDMNQPLASAAGNALEVAYVVDYLTGRRREPRFHEVTVALGAEMLRLAGLARDLSAARMQVERSITSGSAAERFSRMVATLGGPRDLLDRAQRHLTSAPIVKAVHPASSGVVQAVATREVGLAVVALGGGRTRPQDAIDHAVGFSELAALGERVDRERPLGIVHARTAAQAQAAAQALQQAYAVSDQARAVTPVIHWRRRMTLLVAVTGWDVEPWVKRFQHFLPDLKIVTLGEPFDRRDVEYAAAWRHPHGSLDGLPNLTAIFSLGAGVDHLIGDPRLPEVPIVRVVDADLTERMSEYVVLHCLMHLRQQRRYDAQQRQKIWLEESHPPAARDVRVGVMGLGVLGSDAARKLRMMGFDVAGWSRSPRAVEGIATFSGQDGLDALLARTDILVCLLPLTEETRGILNRDLFAKLAREGRLGGPILINAGRGGLQVEADIVASLDEGTLKAATLDVFETEPLPPDSPLWTHPAVTVTPHNAAASEANAISAYVADQIRRLEAGQPLENVVKRDLGY